MLYVLRIQQLNSKLAAGKQRRQSEGIVMASTTGRSNVSFMQFYKNRSDEKDMIRLLHELAMHKSKINFPVEPKTNKASAKYVQDELEVFLYSPDASNSSFRPLSTLKQIDRIGKSNKRYPNGVSACPPGSRAVAIPILPKAGYHKIEQVEWENAIIWGEYVEDQEKSNVTLVVEEDDDMHVAPRPPEATAPVSQPKLPPKPKLVPKPKQNKKDDVVYPIIPPAESNTFEMTRPRTYRWELPTEEAMNNTSLRRPHSTSSSAIVLPCALNPSLEDDAWLQNIGWDHCSDMPPSKIILDENDVHLILSNPYLENMRATLRVPERKLGAHEKKQEMLNRQKKEKSERINDVLGNLDFGEETAAGRSANDDNRKNKDTRIVKHMGHVHHSLPAIKLSLTKPELPRPKLREFHRPRGKFKIHERLAFVNAKEAEQSAKSSLSTTIDRAEADPALSQIKKTSDLNPTAGGKLILIEYIEQRPPMLSNPGMAARVLNYWRPPESKDEHQGDVHSSSHKGKKKSKPVPPPPVSLGQVVTLGPNDDTPFIGDVPPGKMVTSLNSKLFKIPIFKHTPRGSMLETSNAYEYFLLARAVSKKAIKGSKSTSSRGHHHALSSGATITYVMELPPVYIAGQVEPQMEVPAPNSRSANDFIRPYMSFHILRLFKKASDGERLKIEDISRAFPNQSGTAIRKRMKETATFERGGNDSGWWKKKPASLLPSEDEIRANVSPESVCLYESMMSGHRRLMDLGLTKLFTPQGVQSAIDHLTKRLNYRQQLMKTKILVPLGYESRHLENEAKKLFEKDPVLTSLKQDIQVARVIALALELAPWTWTNNYVECHLQGKGSGMLQLGGDGDPSACGDGFSFIRAPQSRAKKKDNESTTDAMNRNEKDHQTSEETDVQKAVAAVTGTTADLRKLKMKEAGEVLKSLGMLEADIKKLRRWDRIEMVRTLSTKAWQRGESGGLSKFARGARKSLNAQQQEYRKKCDARYRRQIDVLASPATEFDDVSEDEEEEDNDLEDLEDDIFGTELTVTRVTGGPVNMFRKDGGGFNRSTAALRERDDLAELERLKQDMREGGGSGAAPLSAPTPLRLHRPELDAGHLRTQLQASGIKDSRSTSRAISVPSSANRSSSVQSSAMPSPSPAASRVHSPRASTTANHHRRQAIKRTTRVIEEDGSETIRIEFIVDPKKIGMFKANQQRKENQAKAEERDHQLRKRKRMQQLQVMENGRNDDGTGIPNVHRIKEELKMLEKKEESTREYVEMLERGGDSIAVNHAAKGNINPMIKCTACGQIGHIRTNRNCPLYMNDTVLSTAKALNKDDRPLKLTVKKSTLEDLDGSSLTVNLSALQEGARKHQAEKKRKRLQDIAETAALYKKVYTGSNAKKSRENVRLPMARLNGHFECVWFQLMNMPESVLFRVPVDGAVVKDYYAIIKRPMDLQRMSTKINALQYDSMRMFLADVELMATNAKIYNGDLNPITKNAFKVLERAKEALQTLNADGAMHLLEKQKLARVPSAAMTVE